MSTAASSSARRCPERAPWLGHNAWWLQIAISVVLLVFILLSYALTLLAGGVPKESAPIWEALDWTTPVFLVLVLTPQYWLAHRQRKHDRQLCIRCVENTPLDTQAAVDKHARALRMAHGPQRLRTVILLLVFLLAAMIGWVIGLLFLSVPWYITTVVITVIIVVGGVVTPWSSEWHRRLQPWCPQCRHRGGWGKDAVPEPSPDPQIRATL